MNKICSACKKVELQPGQLICNVCWETHIELLLSRFEPGMKLIKEGCCTRVFDRKNALYNKEIGYMPDGREEPTPLQMITMADNGSFGLEYLLLGQRNEKTIELLCQGIAFCEYIIKTEKSQTAINAAINIREQFLKFIEGENPTEPEVRAIQGFSNTESAPFLRWA